MDNVQVKRFLSETVYGACLLGGKLISHPLTLSLGAHQVGAHVRDAAASLAKEMRISYLVNVGCGRNPDLNSHVQ